MELLLGIEDPLSKAHAPNESLHAGDFRKLTASIANLFEQIGSLPDGVAASAGIAQWDREEDELALYRRCDEALYAAKRSGCSCARIAH